MESKLGRLSINQAGKKQKSTSTPTCKSSGSVANSWDDDDAVSSGSDMDRGDVTPLNGTSLPNAPPPTPASPNPNFPSWDFPNAVNASIRLGDCDKQDKVRPETSASAAGRLIAAGLGMKAPRKTEDQKAYDRAVRENEMQRRNRQKEAREREQEEKENAAKAVWES